MAMPVAGSTGDPAPHQRDRDPQDPGAEGDDGEDEQRDAGQRSEPVGDVVPAWHPHRRTWEAAKRRVELAARLRGEHLADALLELLERQPSVAGVAGQL